MVASKDAPLSLRLAVKCKYAFKHQEDFLKQICGSDPFYFMLKVNFTKILVYN